MRHFVQYHNPDVMGRYKASHRRFGIVTNKPVGALLGNRVWLVTGSGKPRRYYLCSSFVVNRLERVDDGEFRNHAQGADGRDFVPFIEIGAMPWFAKLLKTTANFSLGLVQIRSTVTIRGLQKFLRRKRPR